MVILGGAFFASGNVNPAAEANVKNRPIILSMIRYGFYGLLLHVYEKACIGLGF